MKTNELRNFNKKKKQDESNDKQIWQNKRNSISELIKIDSAQEHMSCMHLCEMVHGRDNNIKQTNLKTLKTAQMEMKNEMKYQKKINKKNSK